MQIEQITNNIGMVYSGMGPDYRLLIRRARKMAQDYFLMYHEQIPTAQLVYRVALVMQEYTQFLTLKCQVYFGLKPCRRRISVYHLSKWLADP